MGERLPNWNMGDDCIYLPYKLHQHVPISTHVEDGTVLVLVSFNQFASITGDASKIADVLRQVQLPLVNSDDCQNAMRTQFGTGLTKAFVHHYINCK